MVKWNYYKVSLRDIAKSYYLNKLHKMFKHCNRNIDHFMV